MFLFREPHKVSTPWVVMKLFKKLCINLSLFILFGPKTHWIDNDVKLKNLGLARTSTKINARS
jgi:hypothetical protein